MEEDSIRIVITAADDSTRPCGVYASDVLGLVQNDFRYRTFDGYQALAHNLLTASATLDGDDVEMDLIDGSTNAVVPLTVINTRGPELPRTGDDGVWRYSVYGVLLMVAAAGVVFMVLKNKKKPEQSK